MIVMTMMTYRLWSRRGGAMAEPVGLPKVYDTKVHYKQTNVRRIVFAEGRQSIQAEGLHARRSNWAAGLKNKTGSEAGRASKDSSCKAQTSVWDGTETDAVLRDEHTVLGT